MFSNTLKSISSSSLRTTPTLQRREIAWKSCPSNENDLFAAQAWRKRFEETDINKHHGNITISTIFHAKLEYPQKKLLLQLPELIHEFVLESRYCQISKDTFVITCEKHKSADLNKAEAWKRLYAVLYWAAMGIQGHNDPRKKHEILPIIQELEKEYLASRSTNDLLQERELQRLSEKTRRKKINQMALKDPNRRKHRLNAFKKGR